MATSNYRSFDTPRFRGVFVVTGLIWLGSYGALSGLEQLGWLPVHLSDPIFIPIQYLLPLGGVTLWVLYQYRQNDIHLRSLLGPWPVPVSWPPLIGLWLTVFAFSIGAFQVSYTLLSFIGPQQVTSTLNQSIFLTAKETALPTLYNGLTLLILVVVAPILEEFLFRGMLLHRWGSCWGLPTAVIASSLLFGVLHLNVVGLTLFGLVMAMLYLRTRSLRLVIIIHALNNAFAAILELITTATTVEAKTSLETFRASWWTGVLLLLLSTPILIRFFRQNWHLTHRPLPYFTNYAKRYH